MRASNALLGLTTLLALGFQTPAIAANFLWDDWTGWPYGFTASFSQQKVKADVGNTTSDFDLAHAGLELVELKNTWLQVGMFGGKAWGDQTGFALAKEIDLDGYYAGLSVRRMILDERWFKLGLEGRYTYRRLKERETPYRIAVSLHQSDVALGAQISMGSYAALYGGATGMYLDGSETVIDAPSSNIGGKWDGVTFVGIDVTIEKDGHIGIEAKKGAVDGFEIYFQHRY